MSLEQFTRDGGPFARTYEYEDRTVVAVDFGSDGADASVDVVDGTVVVVRGDEQHEFDLPDAADGADTFIKNGVLTVEMEADL